MRIVLLVATLAAIASACGTNAVATPPPSEAPDGAELRGKTFLSTKITVDGKPRPLVPGTRVALSFDQQNRLSAQAGCNGQGGDVRLDGGVIDLKLGPSTLMACATERMKQDEWLAKILTSKPSWTFAEGTLTITSGPTVLTFLDKKQAMPDLGLEDSRWTLESVVSGETVSTRPGSEKAYVRFRDGKVSGSDGCNEFGGTAKVSGSEVVIGELQSTLVACPDPAGVIAAFEKVVTEGTLSVVIDADLLTLTSADGKNGLVLRGSYGRPMR
jgi:heat shock protein HslJ